MGTNLRPDTVHSWTMDYLAKARKKIESKIKGQDTTQNWNVKKQMLNLLAYQLNIPTDKKREIVDVVFPDKINIENEVLRTGRVNDVIKYIYQVENKSEGIKKGQTRKNSDLSCNVGMAG